jgi:translation initiation factor 4G
MAPPPSAAGQPGAPSRPLSQPSVPPFVPSQAPPYMSATATTFQPLAPRKSAAIQIKRPDGTALELAAAKSTTPEPTSVAPTPVRPKSSTPVPIKMESEEGRKARLAEEAEKERLKKEGDKSEQEKKDVKEREAKEAEEKRVADEAAKAKEESVSTAKNAI